MDEQMNNTLNQQNANAEEQAKEHLSEAESTMPHLPVFVENSTPSQESQQAGRVMKSDSYLAQEIPIIAHDDQVSPEVREVTLEKPIAVSEAQESQPLQGSQDPKEPPSFTGIIKKTVSSVKKPQKANSEEQVVERVPRARRMKLSVTRVAPWSVAKVSFLILIALAIVQIVMVAVVWILLNSIGVFGKFTQIVASTGLSSTGFNLADFLSLPTVLSATTIFSIIEVVVFTLIAAILAALYNVVSALVGGVRVTLGDD